MVSKDFGYWFSGLTDGEGSFGCVLGSRPKHLPQPQFQIRLRADDRPVLEYIHRTLGIGNLYEYKSITNPQGYVSKPAVTFMVNKKSDTAKIVELFRQFQLRSKKKRQFEIWSQIVEIRNSKDWRGRLTASNKAEFDKAKALYEKLKSDNDFK